MFYMAKNSSAKSSLKQKNFTLPKKLIRAWAKFLPKEGSQESSKNAAGALFLYMVMPDHLQQLVKSMAYESNIETALTEFWQQLDNFYNEVGQAKAILATARKQAVINKMNARDLAKKKQINKRQLERESSPRRQNFLKKMKEQELARAKVSQAQVHEATQHKKKGGKKTGSG